MSQFSKVVGDNASCKRSPFPLGGRLSTSFQFGEVAPIHCRYLTPNSSSSVNVRSLVRLDPMVAEGERRTLAASVIDDYF